MATETTLREQTQSLIGRGEAIARGVEEVIDRIDVALFGLRPTADDNATKPGYGDSVEGDLRTLNELLSRIQAANENGARLFTRITSEKSETRVNRIA